MDKEIIERIKKQIITGAQTSLTKIGEATRTGKLHLKIIGENRKLEKIYTDLGKEIFEDLKNNSRSKFAQKPNVKKMLKDIKLLQTKIKDLDQILAKENKSPKKSK